jgi:hypothetical protein
LTTRVSNRLGCFYFNRKEKFAKRKQMQRITNTIRQTENKTVNQQDPDRIQKTP